MRLKMVRLCNNPSTETYYERDIEYLTDFPRELRIDEETVMSIDPGTGILGFSIGYLNKKDPLFIGVLRKVKGHANESDTDQYTVKLVEVVMKMIDSFNVRELIIEDQYLIPKYKTAYRRLTTLKDTIIGRCGLLGIKVTQVKPQEWKSIFLSDYKKKYNINMSQSNKEWIQRKTRDLYISAINLSEEDGTDAFGMLYFQYDRYFKEDDGVYIIKPGLQKEWSHNIKYMIGKTNKKDYENIFRMAEGLVKVHHRDALRVVELDKTMDLEENIRSVTSTSNDIYITITSPFPKIMPDLMKERESIGTINSDSDLYVIFFRENKKGGL